MTTTKSVKLLTFVSLSTLLLAASFAYAKDSEKDNKEEAKWDVSNPPGKKLDVKINTKTGTWMSLDVSPDGRNNAPEQFVSLPINIPMT